jgi:hypothetical protein
LGFNPHLRVSMPHYEKLADIFVLLLLPPIYPLTNLGTVQGGLALLSAVLELEIQRCYGATDDAGMIAVGVDWIGLDWSGVRVA